MVFLNFDFKNNFSYFNFLCKNNEKCSKNIYNYYNYLFKNFKNPNIMLFSFLNYELVDIWKKKFKNCNVYYSEANTLYYNKIKENKNCFNINLNNDLTNIEKYNCKFDIIIVSYQKLRDNNKHLKILINYLLKDLKDDGIIVFENFNNKYYLENMKNFYHLTFETDFKEKDNILLLFKNNTNIFKNRKKITIITPSIRPNNLIYLEKSIDFNYVNEWIIVYDSKKIKNNPNLFKHNSKIKEYLYSDEGISGNPQRNFGLSKISNKNSYIYFLDDDNIIYDKLYNLLNILDDNKLYSFNQKDRILGNEIDIYKIDTAMVLLDYSLIKDIKWIPEKYNADGYFFKECYQNNKNEWIYVNNNLCTYNLIT